MSGSGPDATVWAGLVPRLPALGARIFDVILRRLERLAQRKKRRRERIDIILGRLVLRSKEDLAFGVTEESSFDNDRTVTVEEGGGAGCVSPA